MSHDITHKRVEEYLLSMPNAWLDYPFGKDVAVYKIGPKNDKKGNEETNSKGGKMFALVSEGKEPIQLSLKCDPILAETLREKYETVQAGYHLNKKHWNTLVLTGQLPWEEVQALVRHSYDLVNG